MSRKAQPIMHLFVNPIKAQSINTSNDSTISCRIIRVQNRVFNRPLMPQSMAYDVRPVWCLIGVAAGPSWMRIARHCSYLSILLTVEPIADRRSYLLEADRQKRFYFWADWSKIWKNARTSVEWVAQLWYVPKEYVSDELIREPNSLTIRSAMYGLEVALRSQMHGIPLFLFIP